MNAVSINDRWLQLVLIGTLAASLLAIGSYVVLRLQMTYHLQTEVQRLRAEHEDLKSLDSGTDRILSKRVDALEALVYGELEPAVTTSKADPTPRVIIRREAWSANRDKALSERIKQLELWRWQQEYWKKEHP